MLSCCKIEAIGDVDLHAKSQSPFRWLILIVVCMMMMADFYCYDIPAALKSQLSDHMNNPSNFETSYALLYSVYAVPNILLPFCGGYLIDRWGCRTCIIIFSVFLVVGQLVFTVGFEAKSWLIMYLGRVVYAFGGPSLNVGGAALMSQWFAGYELSFAFGMSISVARVGSVINNLISPRIADSDGLDVALWFGVLLSCSVLLGALAIYPVDRGIEMVLRASEKLRAQEGNRRSLLDSDEEIVLEGARDCDCGDDGSHSLCGTDTLGSTLCTSKSAEGSGGDNQVGAQSRTHRKSDKTGMFVDAGPFASPGQEKGQGGMLRASTEVPVVSELSDSQPSKEEGEEGQKVRFSDVLRFPHLYWCVALSCMFVYGCLWPFNNIASTLLLERNYFMEQPNSQCALEHADMPCEGSNNAPNQYCNNGQWYQPPVAVGASVDCSNDADGCYVSFCDGQSHAEVYAAMVMSIPYSIAVCLCPVFGIFVDSYGYRGLILIIAPAILVLVHAMLGYTTLDPIGLMVGQGVAYAMYAATFWSSITVLVEPRFTGLAYGVVISLINIGMSCFPVIVAWTYNTSNDHYIPNVELVFVILSALAFLMALYASYYDNRHDAILNVRATLTIPERNRRSTQSSDHYSDFSYDGLFQRTPTLTGNSLTGNRVSTEAIKYSFVR